MFIMSSFLIPLCALMHALTLNNFAVWSERERGGEREGRRERGRGELRETLSLLQLLCVW